ncbi:hypothetical protein [Neobacillus sp. LXY-4]|uniref:hypothetical protein n=1 Tax=Neobacillus sp. LXY-4 TaxID=3379826 RepID=UPI003EE17474
MYCSNCGVRISNTTEICHKCGVRPFRTKDYCYSCGERNYNKQAECSNCGETLDDKTVSASIGVNMDDSWFASIQTTLPPGLKQLMVMFKRD